MLIFWDQRLVFLATPKAGSTAIETALESLASVSLPRPAALKHTDIATYLTHVGPWLQSQTRQPFTTVALMRDPVDWLRSWFRFRLRDDHDDPRHAMEGVDFADFAAEYARPGGAQRALIGTQSAFLTCPQGTVDQIFRYDRIEDFVDFLETRLDCAIELPRINVPPSVDVHLNPADEARLRRSMSQDLDLYSRIGQGSVQAQRLVGS